MKKLILIGMLVIGGLTAKAQQTIPLATNITVAGVYQLLSSRGNIKQISVSCVTSNLLLEIFNCGSVAAPFYGTNSTNASYVSRAGYTTNLVLNSVDLTGGSTNYLTNSVWYTYNVTNVAATNALTRAGAFVQAAGTIGVYNTDIMAERGVVVRTSGNATLVLYYNTGQ